MLLSMLPHFQNQQTPINQTSRQLPQNYGIGYQQTRTQQMDYAMMRSHVGNQQQNSGYIAVGPSSGNSSLQIPSMASATRNAYSSYAQNMQSLPGQSIQNTARGLSQPLHWQNNASQRGTQQTLPSQPLVQQSLMQLGIPSANAQTGQPVMGNVVSHAQATAQLRRPNQASISQAMNLATQVYGYQHSPSVSQQIGGTSATAGPSRSMSQIQQPNMYRPGSELHPGVLRSQSYSQPSSSESVEREIVRVRLDQKKQAPTPTPAQKKGIPVNLTTTPPIAAPVRKRSTSGYSDTSSNKDDGAPEKTKMKLELDDDTRVVIDDDIEIVGCKQAEVMSHNRADCPIHIFVRVDSVTSPCIKSNEKYCSKCYCYVCDTLASQCKLWTDNSCAHSNAHAKASCWKARRNMKKSPLMKSLTPEEITQEISVAGEKSVQFIIRIRESYITYRTGIPCDFHSVPCDCSCHRDNTLKPESCVSCKAVHDLRKRFNYDPVRRVIYCLLEEIEKDHYEQPYSALVLYEALLSELCAHRPADFNHVTRMPSNPDVLCQCTTPQIMDEKVEPALIKLFTLNEIDKPFKDKFYACVNNSIQPLQLKDVMKRFLTMRHWDDLLLRAVLTGQNTSGRNRSSEMLKETMPTIEMRVKKLEKESRYYAIIRYLKVVKIFKPPKHYEGVSVQLVLEKWILRYTAKLGRFRDVCMKLIESKSVLPNLSVEFALELFTLLSGKNLPPNTQLSNSFENGITSYAITGANQTALCLLMLVYMESNPAALGDLRCYMWIANWVNEQSASLNHTLVSKWINDATQIMKLSQKVMTWPDSVRLQQFTRNCLPFDHQVSLFVSSLLVLRYVTKVNSSFDHIEEFAGAFKNNEWVLFYLFSQQVLLSSGHSYILSWLTKYTSTNKCIVTHFSQEALALLIQKTSPPEVFPFFKNILTDTWTSFPRPVVNAAVKIAAKLATRFLNEAEVPDEVGPFLSDVLLTQILSMQLYQDNDLALCCEVIARASCICGSVMEIRRYKQLFPREHWPNKCSEIFTYFEQKFTRNRMKPDDVALFLRCAVMEGNANSVRIIFSRFTEKHECMSKVGAIVMQEVINILDSQDKHVMDKLVMMDAYTKLCSHETLSWLICAKCSAQMPLGWVKVWVALERNGMSKFLRDLVKQMLHQFTSWMRELCELEENDVKRLLKCLETFVKNVVQTLIQCRFQSDEVKNMLLETRLVIANPQLRSDYAKIIHTSIPSEKPAPPTQVTSAAPALPKIVTPTPQVQQKPPSSPIKKPPPAPVTSPKPSTTPQTSTAANSTPKLDNVTSPSQHVSPKRLMSPGPANGPGNGPAGSGGLSPSVCPQCGDPMVNSFKCLKCKARRNRDIKCPNCGQVNKDLKGYSCRFCYTSLLTELAAGETASATDVTSPPEPQNAPEKKKTKKSKKKKRLEKQASKDLKSPPRDVQSSHANSGSSSETLNSPPGSAERNKHPTKIVLQKMKSQDHGSSNHKHDFQVKSVSTEKETIVSPVSQSHPTHSNASLKIRFRPKDRMPKSVKMRTNSSESNTRQENLSDSDSDSENFKDSGNFYNKVRQPEQRKWNSNDTRGRNHSGSDKPNPTFQPRSPPYGESSKAGPKIPPLILKRKSDEADRSPVHKRAKVEHQVPKRVPSLSKKQRDILQRMKTGSKPKNSIPAPKTASITPKSPPRSAEWEVTRRRKPGPASRTSYYEIHPQWRIPKHLKVPYTLDLPKVCRVHLSPYPPKIMRLIHEHQPNLRLTSLYA